MDSKSKTYGGLFMVGAVVGYFLFLALSNPDMTDTRLMLTYWPHYLIGLILALVGMLLLNFGDEQSKKGV